MGFNDTVAAQSQRKLEREAKKMSSEPAKVTTNMWLFTRTGELCLQMFVVTRRFQRNELF